MPDGALHRYFLNNSDKLLHKWIHYFDIYERHFERFRGKKPVVLEIGVFGGGSLAMWKDYFGEGCKIIGLDIDPDCRQIEMQDVEIFIGSQDDPALIDSIFEKYPNIDVAIDDGSHMMKHMVDSFGLIYPRINARGVYLVEDTHTCYWKEYDGALGKANTFMEYTKSKLDEINAAHTKGAVPISDFTRSTDSITCYDSVVVFERRPQASRQAFMMYPM